MVSCGSHKDMFRGGVQDRIVYALILEESHCASQLKLISTMAKECRKSGSSLVLASQEATDADTSELSGIGSYFVLRSTDANSRFPVWYIFDSCLEKVLIHRVKEMNMFGPLYIDEEKGDHCKLACDRNLLSNDNAITGHYQVYCETELSFSANNCVSTLSTGVSQ